MTNGAPESPRYASRWRALWAAMLGFALDAMDVMLLVFALQPLRHEFGFSNAAAGALGSATLVASAAGGIGAGFLSDRFGRSRILVWTILLYSLASAGSATSSGIGALLVWRTLVGLGLGGEWSAGATLVSESWPPEHRGGAIGFMQAGWAIGYMLAALLAASILPRYGWRALFLAGVAPALLTVFIRRGVAEPEVWRRQQRAPVAARWTPMLIRRAALATAVASLVLFAYWGLFTWLPSFLSAPVSNGGAGLDFLSGTRFVFLSQAGAWFGYVTFGSLADRIGRRVAFAVYVVAAALLVPVYGLLPVWAGANATFWLQILAPPLGFFGSGYFSMFGVMLAELFPTALRGAGQGLAYNLGRSFAALAPFSVGRLADAFGFGAALLLTSVFFLLAAGLIFALPETRNTRLEAVGDSAA